MKKGLVEQKPGAILAFAAYTNKIPNIVKFTIGEPDFNTPEHIKKAAEESIANNQQYDPDEILITNGVTESIYDLLTAVINLGDIMMALNLNQKNCRQYSISMAIKFECWLWNPTGVMYSQEELNAIADVIRDKPIFALCDEIYSELNYDQPHASMEKALHDQVVLMNGVSKAWVMTGYQIGVVAAPKKILDQIVKVHQAITTSEPTPMQDAAEEVFANGMDDALPMKKKFQKRSDVLYEDLQKIGFECVKPKGAFYIFAKIPAGFEQDDTKFIYELAEKAHVAVVAGSFFAKGGEGYIRLS